MVIQTFRVIDTRDNTEVWKGLCREGEGEAIANAAHESKIPWEFLKTEVVEDEQASTSGARLNDNGGADSKAKSPEEGDNSGTKAPRCGGAKKRSDTGKNHQKREGILIVHRHDGEVSVSDIIPRSELEDELELLYKANDNLDGVKAYDVREIDIVRKVQYNFKGLGA